MSYQYYSVQVLIGSNYYTLPVKTNHTSINKQLDDINAQINTRGKYGQEILVSITNITEQEYNKALAAD